MSARAILLDGIRTATVESPPVVSGGTHSVLLNIMVRGPGQYLPARASACFGISLAIFGKSSILAM